MFVNKSSEIDEHELKQTPPPHFIVSDNKTEDVRGLDEDTKEATLDFIVGKAIPGYAEGVLFHINKQAFMTMSPVINAAYSTSESECVTDSLHIQAFDTIHPKAFAKIVEYVEYVAQHKELCEKPSTPCASVNFEYCVPRRVDSEGKSHPGWDAEFIEGIWADPSNRGIFMDILKHANFFGIECLVHKLACRIGCVLMGKQDKEMIRDNEDGSEREETDEEVISRLDNLIDPLGVCSDKNKRRQESMQSDITDTTSDQMSANGKRKLI